MSKKFVIMFVCTGNTCRSPMAEAALTVLLNGKRPGKAEVISSGTSAASNFPATMYAIEASKIWEADLSKHQSKPLTKDLIDKSDLIFAMTPSHYSDIIATDKRAERKTYLFKLFPDTGRDGEGVADPIGRELEKYNETFLEIGECLGEMLPEIVKRIDEKNGNDND